MNYSTLLTSASAMALATGGLAPAFAAEAAEDVGAHNYTLSFEGTFGRLDKAPADKWGQTSELEDKFGSGPDLGYMGAISLSRNVSETRDLSVGLSFGGSMNNDRMFEGSGFNQNFSGGYISTVTNDLSFGAMDVEIGSTRAVGDGNMRMFGGLRGLALNSDSNASFDKTGSGLNSDYLNIGLDVSSSFVGIGPRVGIGYASKAKVGGFGFSGQVGAAALFGQRKDQTFLSAEGYSGGSGGSGGQPINVNSGFSETSSQTVLNVTAKLAVDYYVSEEAKLSVGYQAQQFWNVDAFSNDNNSNGKARLIDGFFVGFTTTF